MGITISSEDTSTPPITAIARDRRGVYFGIEAAFAAIFAAVSKPLIFSGHSGAPLAGYVACNGMIAAGAWAYFLRKRPGEEPRSPAPAKPLHAR